MAYYFNDKTTGSVKKLVDEDHPTIAWIVERPNFCCDVDYRSPEFSIESNIWQLQFDTERRGDGTRHCSTNLILRRYKEPAPNITKKIMVCLMGPQGDKLFEKERDIIVSKSETFDFHSNMSGSNLRELCKKNRDKLVIYCSITDCSAPASSSNDLLPNSREVCEKDPRECTLLRDLGTLFDTKDLSDLTLVLGSSEFHVHKAIIASRSSVFMAMFKTDMQEKNSNIIIIPDIEEKVMEKLLKYIYTDDVSNLDEVAVDLLAASHKYDVPGLKLPCSQIIAKTLNDSNVIESLVLADLHDLAHLKKQALNYMAVHVEDIPNLQGYDSLKSSRCGQDLLKVLSGIETFKSSSTRKRNFSML